MPRMKAGDWKCSICQKEWTAILTYEGEPPSDPIPGPYIAVSCATPACRGAFMQLYPAELKNVSVELVPRDTFRS